MKIRITFVLLLISIAGGLLLAQTAGVMTGTVRDSQGGVIPGAEVLLLEQSTNTATSTLTNDQGSYLIPGLAAGLYAVSVELPGFRRTEVRDVKVTVGVTTTVNLTLHVGEISDSIVVQAAQGQIERQSATVSATVEGRQITELPFTSRSALDLALTQAGVTSAGRPGNSTIGGLRRGALNVQIDGVRAQDHFARSGTAGFGSQIQPGIDAVEEFTLTQAGQSADSAAEGAAHIRFVTRRGSNQFHGGAWWYHRNPVLNANYYFNNLAGIERQRQLLNQVGFRIGGPIRRNKTFFFFTLDSFHLPETLTNISTALTEDAARGILTYNQIGGGVHSVDVLQLASQNGFESSFDPLNKNLIDRVFSSISSLGREPALNPYTQRVRFNNPNKHERYFPTLRLDHNFSDSWRWEGIWHYQYYTQTHRKPPNFPGFEPFGSSTSHRFSLSSAVRTTFGVNKTNEFRVGTAGGTTGRDPELLPGEYPAINIGSQPGNYFPNFPLMTNPLVSCCGERINYPHWQFSDNFTWNRGNHTWTFGTQFTRYNLWIEDYALESRSSLPWVNFGVEANDPAASLFTTSNFPGADSTTLSAARGLYSLLTGRVSSATANVYADPITREFNPGGPDVMRMRQHEFGVFAQDSWRLRPGLTLNMGLRWQMATPIRDLLNKFTTVGGWDGMLGPSFRLFEPGVVRLDNVTTFNLRTEDAYDTDYNNFAPNVGLAWNPVFDGGVLRRLFGANPVFRAGYSIAFINEGLRGGQNTQLRNEGSFGQANLVAEQDFPAGSILIRNGLPVIPTVPERPFDFPLQITERFLAFTAGEFAENLVSPYVQSWSLGIQRELTSSTVMEVRYVGNKGLKLWRQHDINRDDNVFENGLLAEFLLAQNNLAIARALGAGNNFSNQGLPGQVDLPIFIGAFGSGTSSLFGNGTFIAWLDEGQVGSLARNFARNFARFSNLLEAGFPINMIRANPYLNSARWQDSGGWSSYNALQVELRRRMSDGLLFQANYTWMHGLTNLAPRAIDSAVWSIPRTLRDIDYSRGPSEYNIYHTFRFNGIYDLPFGPGRRRGPSQGIGSRLVEGWSLSGIARLQSGAPFTFGNGGRGTFNGDDGGVRYAISRQDLQKQFEIRQTGSGEIFFVPQNMVGGDGRSNPDILAPNITPGTFGDFFFFEGPRFIRADISVAKRTHFGEDLNVEFRAEFLNAFNNTNFLFGRTPSQDIIPEVSVISNSFGRITEAFRDPSTTNDLGGRMVQLVLRINF